MTSSYRTRRGFLGQASRCLLAAAPFSLPLFTARNVWAESATGYGAATNDVATRLLDETAQGEVRSWLRGTQIVKRRNEPRNFHEEFDAPIRFTRPLDVLPLRSGLRGSLGVHQTPYLTVDGKIYHYSELNLPELVELNNSANSNLYCGCPGQYIRRVPIVNDYRAEFTAVDRDRFQHEMSQLGFRPNYFNLAYSRSFCDCNTGQKMVGFGYEVNCECVPWQPENAYSLRAQGLTIARDGAGFRIMTAS